MGRVAISDSPRCRGLWERRAGGGGVVDDGTETYVDDPAGHGVGAGDVVVDIRRIRTAAGQSLNVERGAGVLLEEVVVEPGRRICVNRVLDDRREVDASRVRLSARVVAGEQPDAGRLRGLDGIALQRQLRGACACARTGLDAVVKVGRGVDGTVRPLD